MKIQRTADGFDTLFWEKYGETFHSTHGVRQEAEHVFLKGAGVSDRLNKGLQTSVLEIGFGTGFNFFLTANEALCSKTKIDFTSVEKDVLSHKTFQELNHHNLSTSNTIRTHFLNWRKIQPQIIPAGKYKIEFNYLINLNLLVGDALQVSLPKNTYDAVYLDAFSPDNNPELWTQSFFIKLYGSMKKGATLSTYSAKGSVKRALKEAGFAVFKKEGPAGKREMLTAKK